MEEQLDIKKQIDKILDEPDSAVLVPHELLEDLKKQGFQPNYHVKLAPATRAKVLTLFEQYANQAVIEELRKMRQWKGTIFHDDIMNYFADRIAELKALSPKGDSDE